MRLTQSLIAMTLVFGLANACAEKDASKQSNASSDPQKKAEEVAKNADASKDPILASVENCNYVSGSTKVSGVGKEQCEKLKLEFGADKAVTADVAAAMKAACSFNVNGKKEESTDPAVCAELSKKYSSVIAAKLPELANGETKTVCSYSINGVKKEGNTKEACDLLQAEYLGTGVIPPTVPAVPGGNSTVSCAYNINGVEKKGNTKEVCDALALEAASSIALPAPQAPAPGTSNINCSYAVNGVTEKGTTAAECDALKKKYGY